MVSGDEREENDDEEEDSFSDKHQKRFIRPLRISQRGLYYEKQFKTLTNITTHLGKSGLWIGDNKVLDNLDLNVTIFPNNGTGILRMTEQR